MDIETTRNDLAQSRVVDLAPAELAEGQSRLRVDCFALTTNNVTYGVFGDMLRYWAVFPASDEPDVWGRIPTWGYADCVESRSPDLAVGERIYGFMPMSTEFVITPGRATDRGLFDVAEHRHGLAGTYNSYQRAAADPLYRADREAHQMLLFPLFFTGFIVDDFIIDNDDFGAEQVIISSASAKTSIGAALLLNRRGMKVIGLTSVSNVEFVKSLGIYDQVVAYDAVASIAQVPSVYVDIAGNQDVLFDVHTHLSGLLKHSMVVGNTNWSAETTANAAELPAPAPEFLFAPTQIAKRTQDWGREGLDARMGEAWNTYADWADTWITFEHFAGAEEVLDAWEKVRSGSLDPAAGYICSMNSN